MEAQKLLYYYPEAEPLDRKMLQVGLAEALSKFTRCVSLSVAGAASRLTYHGRACSQDI